MTMEMSRLELRLERERREMLGDGERYVESRMSSLRMLSMRMRREEMMKMKIYLKRKTETGMRKGERFVVGEETIWRASLARVGVGYGEIEEGGGGRLLVESRNCQSRAWRGMTEQRLQQRT